MTWTATKAWFSHSLTIAWGRFQVVAGVGIEIAANAAELLQSTGVGSYVPPKWLGPFTMTCGLVTELSRRRSLGQWPWKPVA